MMVWKRELGSNMLAVKFGVHIYRRPLYLDHFEGLGAKKLFADGCLNDLYTQIHKFLEYSLWLL